MKETRESNEGIISLMTPPSQIIADHNTSITAQVTYHITPISQTITADG